MFRSIFRMVMLLLAVCLLALTACAQMIKVSDNDLLGTADLIIIGTVNSTSTLQNVPYWRAGRAIITVDKVLRGANIDAVTVSYAITPTLPAGVAMSDAGGMSLTVGQQQLFFLDRTQGGYAIVGGAQGMRPVTDADNYAAQITDYPMHVALEGPIGPLNFDKNVAVKIKITNSGDMPIQIDAADLEGFFYSARMGYTVPVHTIPQLPRPGEVNERTPLISPYLPQVVDAGKTLELSAIVSCIVPAEWRLLSADTYVQTPTAVRANLSVQHANITNADTTPSWHTASGWQTVMVGYAPPAE